MEVPSILQGESLKRLLQGAAIGAALTVIVGFNWFHYGFGWTLAGTAEKAASERVDVALVAAYTPVCVEKFVGPANDAKWEEFAKVESWRRDDYVKKAGLATIPGATAPNSSVADACAGVLAKLLDARVTKKQADNPVLLISPDHRKNELADGGLAAADEPLFMSTRPDFRLGVFTPCPATNFTSARLYSSCPQSAATPPAVFMLSPRNCRRVPASTSIESRVSTNHTNASYGKASWKNHSCHRPHEPLLSPSAILRPRLAPASSPAGAG